MNPLYIVHQSMQALHVIYFLLSQGGPGPISPMVSSGLPCPVSTFFHNALCNTVYLMWLYKLN